MEYLDAYDYEKNYLGKFSRDEVHMKGMWHNTVHCWLYDEEGHIYFQVRSDADKFYTTASGHVKAGETIKEAFGREVKEEIGIDVLYDKAELLDIVEWKMDKEKNGVLTKDRAFANVYLLKIEAHKDYAFKFLDGEVKGVGKVKAQEVLDLFNDKLEKIPAEIYLENEKVTKEVTKNDFLVMPHETLLGKYGKILEAVINN